MENDSILQSGGPSLPFLPFFFAGSASRGRICAGVATGTAGSTFLGSGFVRGSGGTSDFAGGSVESSRFGVVIALGLAF